MCIRDSVEETYEKLKSTDELIEIKVSLTRQVIIHRDRFDELAGRLMKTLERLHKQQPLRFNHPRSVIDVEFSYLDQPELLGLVVDELKKQKKVNANINSIGLVGYGPKLSKGQRGLLEELIQTVKQSELKTPSVSCLLYTSPSPRDRTRSRMPSSA